MIQNDIYTMRKTNREVYLLPWGTDKLPRPWEDGYARVMIPLTEAEKVYSQKKCHIQIVKISNLIHTKQ